MIVANDQGLLHLLAQYGYGEDSPEARRMSLYLSLLEKWNARINLTARTDWTAIAWLFEEALWASQRYPAGRCRHLDIGSGAGFPALVMRMVLPAMRLTMVESRSRKAAFLETAAADLGLHGAAVYCGRIEEFLADGTRRVCGQERFDIVSWKAVKLSCATVDLLLAAAHAESEFWVFHGGIVPFEDSVRVDEALTPVRTVRIAGQERHFLSVYRPASGRTTP